MSGKTKAIKEKRRVEVKLDPFNDGILDNLMIAGLWTYPQDAIIEAIREAAEIYTNEDIKYLKTIFKNKSHIDIVRLAARDLADRARAGEFTPEGRTP